MDINLAFPVFPGFHTPLVFPSPSYFFPFFQRNCKSRRASYSGQNGIDVDVSVVIFNPIDDVTAIPCIGSITANNGATQNRRPGRRSMKCIDFMDKQRTPSLVSQ